MQPSPMFPKLPKDLVRRKPAAGRPTKSHAPYRGPVSTSRRFVSPAGFSLLELLTVIAIFGVLASFTMPAVSTVMRASDLRTGSQIVSEQLGLARQMAISKNRSVEVRLYQYAIPSDTGGGKFRAIQTFEIRESGEAVPLGRVYRLPASILIDSGGYLSSIISSVGSSPSPAAVNGADAGYSLPISADRIGV